MVGILSPNSSWDACRLALGNPFGRFHILRQAAYIVEPIEVMALGDNTTRLCICTILELAP